MGLVRLPDVGGYCCDRACLLEVEALLLRVMGSLSGRCHGNSCPEGDALPCAMSCLSLLPWAVALSVVCIPAAMAPPAQRTTLQTLRVASA